MLSDEQMQNLEALGPRHQFSENVNAKFEEMMKNDEELKGVFDGAMKSLTEKKTTKKTRQKAKKKCSKEEEPKLRREEASRQASWEEEFAQGRAYFLSKDYSR